MRKRRKEGKKKTKEEKEKKGEKEDLFRYPFHPRVTAVARKRSRSFCHKGQVSGYS